MVTRSLKELTDALAVEAAMREYDGLGEEEFLRRYGFGPARDYVLVHDGRRYPSKAIAGVAFGIQHPDSGPLKATEFAGGREVTMPALERLGFVVLSPAEVEALAVRRGIGEPGGVITIPLRPSTPSGAEFDPDTHGQGLVSHEQTRKSLAEFLAGLGIAWVKPRREEPRFDLGWRSEGRFFVAEVKSLEREAVEQLRRGLGQVLEYRHRLAMLTDEQVVAVLATSREPTDKSWVEICEGAGVLLVWPPWDRLVR